MHPRENGDAGGWGYALFYRHPEARYTRRGIQGSVLSMRRFDSIIIEPLDCLSSPKRCLGYAQAGEVGF